MAKALASTGEDCITHDAWPFFNGFSAPKKELNLAVDIPGRGAMLEAQSGSFGTRLDGKLPYPFREKGVENGRVVVCRLFFDNS